MGVDEQTLTLSSVAQQHNGVQLSMKQNTTTVELPSYNMTIFFDGNTAHVAGQIEAMQGLCGSPSDSSKNTTLTAEMSSSYSPPGCETQHQGTVDNSINCTIATDHCNLMRQPPFSACHSHTDPEPYISACTHTLCRYPSVDGVDCQFLEAYAQSCSLIANVTLEDWRSTTSCSDVPLCQQPCSAHEFCGEKHWRGRCLCRAVFASKYKPTNSLGEPAICRQNSASVTLAGCLLEDKGIDYSVLHLNDPSCKGQMDYQSHMVTFSFNSSNLCGTEVEKNSSLVLYKNTIMTRNMSQHSVITRHDQVQIDFSCLYTEPDVKSFSFRIRDSSVLQNMVSGVWNYTVQMTAYADPTLTYVVHPDTEIRLNQRVWLQLKTRGLDANKVSIVTDSCWATSQLSPNDSQRYELIVNGCPNANDKTVKLSGNGEGTSNVFSFNMFEFTGGKREIFLHCKLELCVKMGNSCAPTCGRNSSARRRRRASKYVDSNPAFLSMSWSNERPVNFVPIRSRRPDWNKEMAAAR
ncbi:hypothetical protein PBY51_016568 [Eleginops maclovinus]|uniref:ZP domain-containing protein n=1 Tax=Eleginops maclovinus TaxID=56733 RepID=A0AAN7WTP8_ELEMC|nr:hypothetical protein PBY51_016568 [Eleginops maclovinus]